MKKYKNITKTLSVLTVSALLCTTAYAQENSTNSMIAVGAKIGTTGFGIEGRSPIMENLYGRLGVNYFRYNRSANSKSLNYKGKLTFLTVPLMLDYHPFDNSGFRLSAGIAYNDNKLTATAKANKPVTLYGHTYSIEDLGEVKVTARPKQKVSPIIAIGYDSSFISDSAWSYNVEAGVMYSAKTKVRVSATGLAANQQQTIDDINRDANKRLKKITRYLRVLPIVSIGFKYNF